MSTLEDRIQAVEDKSAIAELRARYCHLLDDRDWDGFVDLFTEDGEFAGLARVRGHDEIRMFFSQTVPRLADGFWHFCTNGTAEIDGDTARGRISMEYLSVKDGVSRVSAGHYDDELRRENGVWKFSRRRITFYYFAPLSEGFVGQPRYITPEGETLRDGPNW